VEAEIPDEVLARLLALSEGATAGPWRRHTEFGNEATYGEPGMGYWEVLTPADTSNVILASELEAADAEFIIAARDLRPRLVEGLLRLRRSAAT
jgi:hypothetical protein